MKVEFADKAEQDLEAIGDYIARDNPQRALTFVREIREKCQTLASFPNRFPLFPRGEPNGIRRAGHGNYLIFFVVLDEAVIVLHVLHGATDYDELLGPEAP